MEIMTLSSNSTTLSVISTMPWLALSLTLLAIGYCIGLSLGSINSLDVLKECIKHPDISACIDKVEDKTFWPGVPLVINLVSLTFGAFAIFIACTGLDTWKSEFRHKRNLDLFDFITMEVGKIRRQLELSKNTAQRISLHQETRGTDSQSNATESIINFSSALARISQRIESEAIVNEKLLIEFGNVNRDVRKLMLFLAGLTFEYRGISSHQTTGGSLYETEAQLIVLVDNQLSVFKRFCRDNLAAVDN
jgi:hypothetical protein